MFEVSTSGTPTSISETPPPIQATLLGQVRIMVGSRIISEDAWSLQSARSLFLLLLITPGHAIPKERVLDCLWSEASPDVGRNALYKALHLLRRVLEPDLTKGHDSAYIETRGGTIGIMPDVDVWVDIDACEKAIRKAALAEPDERRAPLRSAVAMYGGDMLPTDPYEDWPVARRVAAHRAWETAVLELAALDTDAGEPQASMAPLEALLAIDPAVEAAHRTLMCVYAASGQRSRALRQYARCQTALNRELDSEPDEETTSLFTAIQTAEAGQADQPRASTGPFNNLPALPSRTVGRDREGDSVQGLLWRQDVRLVTLTGPGGVGKTRLALEAAAGMVEDFADGVAYVPLATMRDPDLVIPTIARTLGISEESQEPLARTLQVWLRERELLLVLDNFEHVLDAAVAIGDLLAACPSLTILVTSRERLQLRGEHIHEVRPLIVPRPDHLPSPDALARYGSVALFSQHMRQMDADFQVTEENSENISAICNQLDGLPLAIELAAARARFSTLHDLEKRLTSRLDFLEDGPRDLPIRQRTLRATFAWSYDMLALEEQAIFRRLGICIGGCTLAAAATICGAPKDDHAFIQRHLHSLAEKHLVRWEEHDDEPRWRMLETVREFAMERLRENGDEPETRRRHAGHYLELATQAEEQLTGTDQLAWLEHLETEQGNLRSALGWALEQPDKIGALAIDAASALRLFWWHRGQVSEGVAWLERAAARSGTEPEVRARGLLALAFLFEVQSDYSRAEALIDEALPISRLLGDLGGVAKAMTGLGEIAENRGDFQRAATMHREALELCRGSGHRRGCAVSLNNLATVAYQQGNFRQATTEWEEAVAIFRALGDHRAVGVLIGNLGMLAMTAGDFDRAVAHYQESRSIANELNDPGAIGRALCNISEAMQLRGDGDQDAFLEAALVMNRQTRDRQSETQTLTLMANSALRSGDSSHAASLYAESLSNCQTTGDRTMIVNIALFERIAALALATAQIGPAARLLGSGDALREELGTPIMPYLRPLRDRCLDQLRFKLSKGRVSAAIAEGHALSPDAAIDEALAACERAQSGQAESGTPTANSVLDALNHPGLRRSGEGIH